MSDSQEMFPPEKQPQDAKGAGSLSLPKTKLEVLGSITKYASFILPTAFGFVLLSVWAYLM